MNLPSGPFNRSFKTVCGMRQSMAGRTNWSEDPQEAQRAAGARKRTGCQRNLSGKQSKCQVGGDDLPSSNAFFDKAYTTWHFLTALRLPPTLHLTSLHTLLHVTLVRPHAGAKHDTWWRTLGGPQSCSSSRHGRNAAASVLELSRRARDQALGKEIVAAMTQREFVSAMAAAARGLVAVSQLAHSETTVQQPGCSASAHVMLMGTTAANMCM